MAIRNNAPLSLADSIIDGLGSQRTAALLGWLDAVGPGLGAQRV